MGGGGSKPRPPNPVIEDPPPAGSGRGSILYPDTPLTPRLDGLSRSLANQCNRCSVEVLSGVTVSSVQLSREYGTVAPQTCKTYEADRSRVAQQQMALQDFLNKLRSGEYYQDLNNGYCRRVDLSADDAAAITSVDQVGGKLRTVRIQKMSSGGFSADTKVRVTPSIPFRIRVTAAGQSADVAVTSMSLYHPAPLRLEGEQADAILSLNDPSFDDPSVVILIPLVGRNVSSPSIPFLQKIMSQSVSVSEADPSTGEYAKRDVATGVGWSLDKVFTARKSCSSKNYDVLDGFYQWQGMPTLERVKTETQHTVRIAGRVFPTGQKTIRYSWVPSGKPSPRYLMLDKPVACNPVDLATLTQRMPVTPPEDAIHAILYSSNPLNRGIVHKEAQSAQSQPVTREGFTDLQGVDELSCDPWTTWANNPPDKRFSTSQILEVVFSVLIFLAMAVGAFLALIAVLKMFDVEYAQFAEGIGKVTAVFAKSFKEKVASVRSTISNVRGAVANPAGLIKANVQA